MDEPSAKFPAAVAESGFDIGSAAVIEMPEEQSAGSLLLDSGVDLSGTAAPSSGSMEGAVLIEDTSGPELLHPSRSAALREPSSDSDILIGADTSGAALGGAMLLES